MEIQLSAVRRSTVPLKRFMIFKSLGGLEVYLQTKLKIFYHAIPNMLQTYYFGYFRHA